MRFLKGKMLVGIVVLLFIFGVKSVYPNEVTCQNFNVTSNLDLSNINVKIYQVKSNQVQEMYIMLIDSLTRNWGCSSPSFLWLTIDMNENQLILSSTNRTALQMAINTLGGRQDFSAFRIGNTLVFCQQIDILFTSLCNSYLYEKTISLDDLLVNYTSKECNYFSCGNNKFSLLYSINYTLEKNTVLFKSYKEFVEFGDFFLYANKRVLKEMEKDSICYKRLLRYRSKEYN